MRTLLFVAIGLLCVFVADAAVLPEFVPCSFHVMFQSRVLNPSREVIATSTDHVYFDGEQYWRWDSDFTGVPPILDAQYWSIIWRPDLDTSFHDLGDKCILNDGDQHMAPPPYDWFLRATSNVKWIKEPSATWEGMPVDIYSTKFIINRAEALCSVNVFILQEDQTLMFLNGTGHTDSGVDVTFHMDAVEYEHGVALNRALFIPSARCTNGTIISAPAEPSEKFKKSCYVVPDAGSRAGAFWTTILVLLFAVLLA